MDPEPLETTPIHCSCGCGAELGYVEHPAGTTVDPERLAGYWVPAHVPADVDEES